MLARASLRTCITVDPAQFGATREEIESRPVWKPMHLQPVFKGCPMRGGSVSEDLFNRGLCLPSGTAMSQTDLERVAAVIRSLL